MFISGELHGDEVIGPQVVCETATELVAAARRASNGSRRLMRTAVSRDLSENESDRVDRELSWLVNHRSIWMIAMSNPHGYYHNRR